MLLCAKVEREGVSVNTTIYLELESDNSPQQFIYCHIFVSRLIHVTCALNFQPSE